MTLPQAGLLLLAAILGGTLNAVAGGGSFVTFPALIFTGVPSVDANATSTVALWPGTVASTTAYREEFGAQR
ncbi:MAG TPA: TSUP family transporter, partial [Herpetosiphonaceae bacterium]|nr:TSUP family transporter [Herpetosiphonaceae bacterium]